MRAYKSTIEQRSGETTTNRTSNVRLRIWFLLLGVLGLAGCLGNGSSGPPPVDFSISVSPGAQAVTAGQTVAFTISVNSGGTTPVDLSVTGAPAGSNVSFSNSAMAGSSTTTLSISTSISTPTGTTQLTIAGSNVTGSQTANASLTVNPAPPPDFSLTVTPSNQNTLAGGTVKYQVNVISTGSSPVNLSTPGLPSGITASFDKSSVTGTGTANLTVSTASGIPLNLYNLNVAGADPSGKETVGVSLAVVNVDFSLAQLIGSAAVTAGGTVTGNLKLTPVVGSPGAINLSVTNSLPPGVSVTLNPNPVILGIAPLTANLTVVTDATTPPLDLMLNIQASDSSGNQTVQVPINIVAGNPGAGFFLAVTPANQVVNAGSSSNYALTVTTSGGPIPAVNFSVQGFLSGTSFQVNPMGGGVFQLIVSAGSDATAGLSDLTIEATGPGGSQSLIVTLTVNQVCIECPLPPPPPPCFSWSE